MIKKKDFLIGPRLGLQYVAIEIIPPDDFVGDVFDPTPLLEHFIKSLDDTTAMPGRKDPFYRKDSYPAGFTCTDGQLSVIATLTLGRIREKDGIGHFPFFWKSIKVFCLRLTHYIELILRRYFFCFVRLTERSWFHFLC